MNVCPLITTEDAEGGTQLGYCQGDICEWWDSRDEKCIIHRLLRIESGIDSVRSAVDLIDIG